jgi:hypothetical protein
VTAAPEPSTWAMLLIGSSASAWGSASHDAKRRSPTTDGGRERAADLFLYGGQCGVPEESTKTQVAR